MVRIAALDDEEKYIDQIKEITKATYKEGTYEFHGYTNVEHFLFDMEDGEYDIILLDMELPGTSGLKVGGKVRLLHPEAFIIFITNHVEHAVEAYEINTFRYIPKIMMKDKLSEAYKLLWYDIEVKERKYFVIQNQSKQERIPEDNIYYMVKDKKYVRIVHRYGESRVRMTMDEAFDRITPSDFIRLNRGEIASLRHIMSLESYKVKMRDGTFLSVSRPQLAKVKDRIMDYWSGMYKNR